ncbi:MAG: iron-sulfur cluster biosynthesis family protein [Thermoplasmata archaeon]|jgi:iron-sulfur cluster assembly accessory protein
MVHVEVRPAAVSQVHTLIRGQKPEVGVRVYALPGGGGCCGGGTAVAFGLAFAKPRPDDEVLRVDGFALLIDPASSKLVDGAVVDYVEGLKESGFKITNPTLPEPDEAGRAGGCTSCGSNSSNGGGCGCGSR